MIHLKADNRPDQASTTAPAITRHARTPPLKADADDGECGGGATVPFVTGGGASAGDGGVDEEFPAADGGGGDAGEPGAGTGGGDDGGDVDDLGGGVVEGGEGVAPPPFRTARTTTMRCSPAWQRLALPLMKK
jgi:hypothetical protein